MKPYNGHEANLDSGPDSSPGIRNSDKRLNRRKDLRSISYNRHDADLDWSRLPLNKFRNRML